MAYINHFYFYLWDAEWGGTFWGSDSNGAKAHVKGRSWDRLASQDLSPSVSQGTIWRYVAVDGSLVTPSSRQSSLTFVSRCAIAA